MTSSAHTCMMEKRDVEGDRVDRTEKVELAVLCMVYHGNQILVQNRQKDDWRGWVLPGGHVELGESFVDAVIREIREETGLTIRNPKLCGIKQFPGNHGRYVVPLFKTNLFEGTLRSSEEGEMRWVSRRELPNMDTVADFEALLSVLDREDLTEFQYVPNGDHWDVRII